jgi:hypothetical protein
VDGDVLVQALQLLADQLGVNGFGAIHVVGILYRQAGNNR